MPLRHLLSHVAFLVALLLALPLGGFHARAGEGEEVVRLTLHNGMGNHEPLVLVFAMDSKRAIVLAPTLGDVRRSRGSISAGEVEVKSRSLSTTAFSCDVQATPRELNDKEREPIQLRVTCKREGDTLMGTFKAEEKKKKEKKEWEGQVTGAVEKQTTPPEAALLVLDTPYPTWNNSSRWNGSGSRAIPFVLLKDGKPTSVRSEFLFPRFSPWDEKVTNTIVIDVPGAAGEAIRIATDPGERLGAATNPTGSVTPEKVTIAWSTNTKDADAIRVEGERYGSLFVGRYEKLKGGEPIGHGNNALGFIGSTTLAPPPLPDLKGKVSLETRLAGHVNWLLWRDISIAPFTTDMLLHTTRTNGNKQYDNEPVNGAAAILSGVLGMKTLTEPDQAHRAHRAREIALRGGSYLAAMRRGPRNLPEYYKHDFWFSVPMGIGFLRLYEATGDEIWLKEATTYATTMRQTQLESGTWTHVDEESETIGKANHRNDRSWDNLPMHCAEHLYFLGLLRTVGGVEEFKDVEHRAAAWMAKATLNPPVHKEVDYLWRDRRPGEARESSGPTWYLLYLGQFGETLPAEVIQALHAHLAEHHLQQAGQGKMLTDWYPRAPEGFHMASTMRYALALKLLDKRKAKGPDGLIQPLMQCVADAQSPKTGLIWIGPKQPEDPQAFAASDQHPWAFYKADIGWNLYRFLELDSE